MRAIAIALRSIANLTGLTIFNELAKPFQEVVNTQDKVRHQIAGAKSKVGTTVSDVKAAANQNKAS